MAIKLEDWLPQEPNQGPPLPEFLNIYWPWYKPPETLGAELAITLSADPNALVAGTTYPAIVTVTNKSTKQGVASPATFTVKVGAVLAGVNLDAPISQQSSFAAGEPKTFTFYQFTIPADGGGKSGTITATVFDPSMKQIAQGSLPIAVQAAVSVTGTLSIPLIGYAPMTTWENLISGRQVPVGVDIVLGQGWVNTSSVPIVGHVDALLIQPDGANVYLTAVSNQDRSATPGNGFLVQFAYFKLTQEGTYSLSITLSSEGKVLNSQNFTLVAVAEIVYGADVVISV